MTGTDGASTSPRTATAAIAPMVWGVLAALVLLALGQAATVCNGVQVCAEPGERLQVAIGWTVVVVLLAAIAAAIRTIGGASTVIAGRVAFGALVVATGIGIVATLATGGFAFALMFW